eukprot:13054068-Alexandrium_andersonii.AAC.1
MPFSCSAESRCCPASFRDELASDDCPPSLRGSTNHASTMPDSTTAKAAEPLKGGTRGQLRDGRRVGSHWGKRLTRQHRMGKRRR